MHLSPIAGANARTAALYHTTEFKEAHAALAERVHRTVDPFEREKLEHALDHLVDRPSRHAGGHRLAENLRRNAAKVAAVRAAAGFVPLDGPAVTADKKALARLSVAPAMSSLEETELRDEMLLAAEQIRAVVDAMPHRVQRALHLKLREATLDDVKAEMGVGKRQFNKLVAEARAALNASPAATVCYLRLAAEFGKHPNIAQQAMAQTFELWRAA